MEFLDLWNTTGADGSFIWDLSVDLWARKALGGTDPGFVDVLSVIRSDAEDRIRNVRC